jgi:hypothetical protein
VCASWEAIAADWHSDLCKKGFSKPLFTKALPAKSNR